MLNEWLSSKSIIINLTGGNTLQERYSSCRFFGEIVLAYDPNLLRSPLDLNVEIRLDRVLISFFLMRAENFRVDPKLDF